MFKILTCYIQHVLDKIQSKPKLMVFLLNLLPNTLHCLIEDTCLLFSRIAFLLDAFYCTLDDHLKDQHVYNCTLDFDKKLHFSGKR